MTDYGDAGPMVGALEGSIYSTNLDVRISSITHQVKPFDLAEGSYILTVASAQYPKGTVFLVGVDPGTGMKRTPIVLQTADGKLFVAPDNGILTGVMDAYGIKSIHEIRNHSLMRQSNISSTFNARDIYAPVAARLAGGMDVSTVGPASKETLRLSMLRPTVKDQDIMGSISYIDNFGNVITNIPGRMMYEAGFSQGDMLFVSIGNSTNLVSFAGTYGDVKEGSWVTMVGANGMVEVARNMASAAKSAEASVGGSVWITSVGQKNRELSAEPKGQIAP
jgi:S-adenosylmethionine hydrolase